MAGYLLARAGIETLVLEKHADFFRDFRGDTVHPSTLEVMHELGILADLLKIPHSEIQVLRGQVGDAQLQVADFRKLPTTCKFIAFMPQWDLLNFLSERAKRYPTFQILLGTEAIDVLQRDGRIAGVRARSDAGDVEIECELVIAADGRHSVIRQRAGMEVLDIGAPIDVLWMRISRKPEDQYLALGRIVAGRIFVTIPRDDYWQCAYVIPKDGFETVRARGLQWLRDDVAKILPAFGDRVDELREWDDVKLLTVRIDRLREWSRPGLLCIGDAAHAMSPVGGVGINLAIQDAVAAANALVRDWSDLGAVQRRREFPTRATQAIQAFIQRRIFGRALGREMSLKIPSLLRMLIPHLSPWIARVIGVGVRPEHVRTPERV
jgi:2-polyprenyl-6-methoxyphenol hydroxylase-like FAD-dependent oxidoreductase